MPIQAILMPQVDTSVAAACVGTAWHNLESRGSTPGRHALELDFKTRGDALHAATMKNSAAKANLDGTLALITGASRGIGAELANAFAGQGMRLLLSARSAADLDHVAANLRARGVEVHTIAGDITQRETRQALIDKAENELGGLRLLVNNAGIEMIAKFESVSDEEVERMLQVNLFAPMALTRLALPSMQRRRCGHVLNVASMAGLAGVAHGETYATTKHGLIGFTRSLRASAQRERTGVSASVICPGFIDDTGMYSEWKSQNGAKASALFRAISASDVVAAALRAVKNDLPDVLVAPGPMRLALAMAALAPRLGETVGHAMGAHDVFTHVANTRE
jgi:short-subunit dehydrogenase